METQQTDLLLRECREGCQGFNKWFKVFAITLLGFIFAASPNYAQSDSLPFQSGEVLNFDIRYKYGLVMLKAGTAKYKINAGTLNGQPSYRSSLDFKTSSFFDKIFMIRDTLYSHASNPELTPLYHKRSVNEGSTHFKEDVFILKHTPTYSEARVKRERNNEIRFDTILTANKLGYDLLNLFVFIRTLDYSTLKVGDNFQLVAFMDKSNINIILHYVGQSVIEKSSKVKYKTHKFNVDIADKAFNTSKKSLEVWISDDDNRIPLKLKAQLKIGAAEADLSSYSNLKNSFNAEVKIQSHK